MASRKRGHRH
jgi:ElaB/YqjD/DUF883 family membrane-anchored ribosome-binding protein